MCLPLLLALTLGSTPEPKAGDDSFESTSLARHSTSTSTLGSEHQEVVPSSTTANQLLPDPRRFDGSPLTPVPARIPRIGVPGAPHLTLGLAALGGLLGVKLAVPPSSGWAEPIFFDEVITSAVVAISQNRGTYSDLSDAMDRALLLYPFVESTGAWAFDAISTEDYGALLTTQALTVLSSALLVSAAKSALSRARPDAEVCPDGTFGCRSVSSRQSFPSGHATTAFTSAGLVCAEQQALRLFGAASWVACAAAVTVASADAVLRVVSLRHHPTDILGGALLGSAIGYLLPRVISFEPTHDSIPHDPWRGWVLLRGGLVSSGSHAASAGGVEAGGELEHHLGVDWVSQVRMELDAVAGPRGDALGAEFGALLGLPFLRVGAFVDARRFSVLSEAVTGVTAGPALDVVLARGDARYVLSSSLGWGSERESFALQLAFDFAHLVRMSLETRLLEVAGTRAAWFGFGLGIRSQSKDSEN